MDKYARCPCDSKLLYHKCCKPYHEGALPDTAEQLMRSRYCAYALGLADYIIDTTHHENGAFTTDRERWKADLETFCKFTKFDRLKVHHFEDGEKQAIVKFTAYLRQADRDASFSEESLFEKVDGRWLYKDGKVDPVVDSAGSPG